MTNLSALGMHMRVTNVNVMKTASSSTNTIPTTSPMIMKISVSSGEEQHTVRDDGKIHTLISQSVKYDHAENEGYLTNVIPFPPAEASGRPTAKKRQVH